MIGRGSLVKVEKHAIRCVYDDPPAWRSVLNHKDKHRYWQFPYPTPYDPSPDFEIIGPHRAERGFCHWRLEPRDAFGYIIGEVRKQAGRIERGNPDDGGWMEQMGTLNFYEVAIPSLAVARCKIILAPKDYTKLVVVQ